MDNSISILSLAAGAVAATAVVAPKVKARIELSRAKHRSLAGHSKMSRRVARLVPFYEFGIDAFFRTDGAPMDVATQRQDGFFRLAALYQQRFAQSKKATAEAATQISDLQFTQAYRVPFQYSRLVRENLGAGSFLQASSGVTVTGLRVMICSTMGVSDMRPPLSPKADLGAVRKPGARFVVRTTSASRIFPDEPLCSYCVFVSAMAFSMARPKRRIP